jgi:hypothetical protein
MYPSRCYLIRGREAIAHVRPGSELPRAMVAVVPVNSRSGNTGENSQCPRPRPQLQAGLSARSRMGAGANVPRSPHFRPARPRTRAGSRPIAPSSVFSRFFGTRRDVVRGGWGANNLDNLASSFFEPQKAVPCWRRVAAYQDRVVRGRSGGPISAWFLWPGEPLLWRPSSPVGAASSRR